MNAAFTRLAVVAVIALDTLAARIREAAPAAGATTVVALDGPAGSGKTTLAARLAARLDAPVVHMDDLYPGWDGLAVGARHVAEEVLVPLSRRRPARYRRWDWYRDDYDGWVDVPPVPVLLIEGCGSGSTPGAAHLSMLLWVEAPHDVRRRRGIDRDGEGFRPHWERWARQEDALFAAERTRERADLLIDTSETVPHDPRIEVVVEATATVRAMRVAELNIHPVKSTAQLPVAQAVVEPWGMADDRRWMIVDSDGYVVTARERRELLQVSATPLGAGRLRLEAAHAAPIDVDARAAGSALVPVQVWRSRLEAVHADPAADAWIRKLIDVDVRLVWLDDPTRRPVNPAYGTADDHVSFADGYPLLLTTTASLRRLNDWIAETALERGEIPPDALAMRRFRPNVVIDAAEPFAEDHWRRVRVGGVAFRVVKPCDRCVMTTIDPSTLDKGKEPLRTLARHRRWDGKVWFGTNLIPDGTGVIAVGDDVTVLE